MRILFWIKWNEVNLNRTWAKAVFPAVLFSQSWGIIFTPACSASSAAVGSEKPSVFIYLPPFTRATNCPIHPRSAAHICTSGRRGFPAVVYWAFVLHQPGVNCLAQGQFHKSSTGMCLIFFLGSSLMIPGQGFEETTFSEKPNSLSFNPHSWDIKTWIEAVFVPLPITTYLEQLHTAKQLVI